MFSKLDSTKKISLPAFALMMATSLLPLLEGGFDNDSIYWMLLFLAAVAVILFFKDKPTVSVDFYHPLFWYVLFTLWCGVSIFWSLDPHRTLVEFFHLCAYGLVFMLALTLNEDNIYRVGRIIVIAGLGVSFFGFLEYLVISTGRIESTFPNANPLGTYLMVVFLLLWAYSLRRTSPLLFVPGAIILAALFLSGSRGAFISLAVALPFLFLALKNRQELLKAAGKTLLCLVLAALLTQGIMTAGPYIQDTVTEEGEEFVQHVTRPDSFIARSGAGRLEFWKVGARLGASEPVLGHGLGTYYVAYFLEYIDGRWFSRFAHNHYIQVLAENGIVGLTLFAGCLLAVLRVAVYKLKQNMTSVYFAGIVSALIGFLIHIGGDFSFNFPGAAVVFFAAAGVLCRDFGKISQDNPGNGNAFSRLLTSLRSKLGEKRLGYKIITASLVLLILLTAWQQFTRMYYTKGIEYEEKGKIQEAAQTYDRANSIYPINSGAYSFASNSYFELYQSQGEEKYLEKAISRATQAVELSPVDSVDHNRLGMLYREADNYEKAEKHLQNAVKYAGFRIGMYLDLATFYVEHGENDKAREVLREGLEIKDDALDSARSEEDTERTKSYISNMKFLLEELE